MDEASLEAAIEAYKQQLQQIETVLQSAGSEGLEDLLTLKKDLTEVIELTQGSLLSLRKSNLLSYVDDLATTPGETERDGHADSKKSQSNAQDMDDEFAAFQAAIADDTGLAPSVINTSSHSAFTGTEADDDDDNDDDDDADDDNNGDVDKEFEDIAGTKCSMIYRHEWGAQQRHNAIVLSMEPQSKHEEEVSVRVLFCNPTNASMKPCPFYFKGECKFGEDDCRFSHGHIVKVSDLRPFQEVDVSELSIESKCLAKFEDDIWYPAIVTDKDPDTGDVTVCFESYGNSATVKCNDILPTGTRETSSDVDENDQEDDDDDDDSSSDLSDRDTPSTSSSSRLQLGRDGGEGEGGVDVLWMPSGPSCRLGEWEAHTTGIGSRLMAKMGYEIGKGLGKRGEGRTEPVEAVICPAGKSLDMCMKLREMKKLGIVGKKKKRRGKGKKKKKGKEGQLIAGKLKKAKDVFEFINTHLGAKKVKVNELLADNTVLVKTHRVHREENKSERKANARQLNVQLLKTQEEMRSTEKRLKHLKQSLVRNQRDKPACATIQAKITKAEDYMVTLKASQRKLERQKTTRDDHQKLTIF